MKTQQIIKDAIISMISKEIYEQQQSRGGYDLGEECGCDELAEDIMNKLIEEKILVTESEIKSIVA